MEDRAPVRRQQYRGAFGRAIVAALIAFGCVLALSPVWGGWVQ